MLTIAARQGIAVSLLFIQVRSLVQPAIPSVERFQEPTSLLTNMLLGNARLQSFVYLSRGATSIFQKRPGLQTHMTSLSTNLEEHSSFVERVKAMTGDPLEKDGGRIVVFRGSPTARLMMIGEAPGAEEDEIGLPFVGRSGRLLDDILRAVGVDPEKDIYVTNIVRRRPPENRTPTPEELDFYLPTLLEEIQLVDPDVIVTLGASSMKALLPYETRGITKTRGRWVPAEKLAETHGGLLAGRLMMPWFHPSYLLRNAGEKSRQEGGVRWLTREDLREVKRALQALGP